jgi:hypothetical protein
MRTFLGELQTTTLLTVIYIIKPRISCDFTSLTVVGDSLYV